MDEYEILLIWDDEARVWIAQNDDIPIVLENGSLDLLMEQVRIAVPEILELNGNKSTALAYLAYNMRRFITIFTKLGENPATVLS